MSNNSIWITESNPTNQFFGTAFLFLIGIAFTFGFRNSSTFSFSGESAGFFLGILLIIASITGILFNGKQTIIIDPKKQLIILKSVNRLGDKERKVLFSEISKVYVGEHGDTDGGSIRYFVVVKLKTGKEVNLFFGFFDDAHNKLVMESRCNRLNELLSIKK